MGKGEEDGEEEEKLAEGEVAEGEVVREMEANLHGVKRNQGYRWSTHKEEVTITCGMTDKWQRCVKKSRQLTKENNLDDSILIAPKSKLHRIKP